MPQGASASMSADEDQDHAGDAAREDADLLEGRAPQARIGLKGRGDPGLVAQGTADELVGDVDRQEQEGDQDRDPDRLVDQERGERHVAAEHAGRSPRRRGPSR